MHSRFRLLFVDFSLLGNTWYGLSLVLWGKFETFSEVDSLQQDSAGRWRLLRRFGFRVAQTPPRQDVLFKNHWFSCT